jgi:S1-C subfamily serine protease
VAVNGQRMEPGMDLSLLILPHEPGDTITLRVLRSDSAQDVPVTLAILPEDR